MRAKLEIIMPVWMCLKRSEHYPNRMQYQVIDAVIDAFFKCGKISRSWPYGLQSTFYINETLPASTVDYTRTDTHSYLDYGSPILLKTQIVGNVKIFQQPGASAMRELSLKSSRWVERIERHSKNQEVKTIFLPMTPSERTSWTLIIT